MYNSEFSIEYNSDYILIISNCSNEEFLVISLDSANSKVIKIPTWLAGLTNEEIELAIQKVLNDNYDIEYELELYRSSDLYRSIKEYSEVE